MTTTETRQLHLQLPAHKRAVEALLRDAGLRLDPVDIYIGVFDFDDNLIGGAGLKGNVIKCVAVSEEARGLDITGSLISRLRTEAAQEGITDLFLFTKPENESVFRSLAFHTVGRAPKAILMETNPRGISSYCNYLRSLRRPGSCGAIVMNCNPFTKGHRYLIEQAAGQVDNLYVIPVKEDASEYSYAERREMIAAGCRDLENVTVCEGSPYAISRATFPDYFIKNLDESTDASILLDLDIFSSHIAPALGTTIRFAGSEPADALTRRYNSMMQSRLPDFREIERLSCGSEAISASRVRELIATFNLQDAIPLLHPSSLPIILAHEAARALMAELHCTPKPGLVDEADAGAHTDMTLPLMERSIQAIRPYFSIIAREALAPASRLQQIGADAEQAMLSATGGVNTHKGAIFSMSLAIAAFMRLLSSGSKPTAESICAEISRIASDIPRPKGTHGQSVTRRYGVPGALETARSGYPELAADWLPFLISGSGDALHRTLLRIMSSLDDSNVIHRAGLSGAEYVKQQAQQLLDNYSHTGMKTLNRDFIARNISPGGAADMLALTLLFRTLCGEAASHDKPKL